MLKANERIGVGDSQGFRRMFVPDVMTLGLFFPIEAYEQDTPTMRNQERLAARAEDQGFAALWTRDVPLRDPSFGDVGQVYDPWVWLGWIAAHTTSIALATGSIILPLRHPLHTAKAAASVDRLSGGRLVMGVASGDRPVEFPAFGVDWERRDVLFRENLALLRKVRAESFPSFQSVYGTMFGTADLVPKPYGNLPILITGSSRQTLDWIASHADGWITYPRGVEQQATLVAQWRAKVEAVAPGVFKPFAQSLYLDLAKDPNAPPETIHLGFRSGRNFALRFFTALRIAGVNHVAINLKYSKREAVDVMDEIAAEILPSLEVAVEQLPLPSHSL
jgi:luciferase-type oxidoreductase